jgi:hypothetical protein
MKYIERYSSNKRFIKYDIYIVRFCEAINAYVSLKSECHNWKIFSFIPVNKIIRTIMANDKIWIEYKFLEIVIIYHDDILDKPQLFEGIHIISRNDFRTNSGNKV